MKKLIFTFLLIFNTLALFGQIQSYTNSRVDGAILISPDGIKSSKTGGGNDSTNVSVGPASLERPNVLSNSESGRKNSAFGSHSLQQNTTGYGNTAVGFHALKNNNTGIVNTALGFSSLANNTSGYENVGIGQAAMISNTIGDRNVALGTGALLLNTTGSHNTAVGHINMWFNSTGIGNTSIGYNALKTITTGNYNTSIGYMADVSTNNLTNTLALGYQAVVNVSNKAVIGNASLSTIGGYGAWTNYSDFRLKENIEYDQSLGLNFILQLKPAFYQYKADQNHRKRYGLIAQDVQKYLKDSGQYFSGLVEDDDEQKTLNISYVDLIMPLINAIQEQQKQIIDLKNKITNLENK